MSNGVFDQTLANSGLDRETDCTSFAAEKPSSKSSLGVPAGTVSVSEDSRETRSTCPVCSTSMPSCGTARRLLPIGRTRANEEASGVGRDIGAIAFGTLDGESPVRKSATPVRCDLDAEFDQ